MAGVLSPRKSEPRDITEMFFHNQHASPQNGSMQDAPAQDDLTKKNGVSAEVAPPPGDVVLDLERLFKMLSDKTRLRILYFLMQRDELDVRTLCGLLKQSQPAVSHHLALLRDDHLIECRRDGKHNFYHLLPSRFEHYLKLLFSATLDQGGRICFENFMLTFKPNSHSGGEAG